MKIQIKGLCHTYKSDTRKVLNIPEHEFQSGQQILLRGISGSGKTTFFNILSGLLRPTQGEVYFDDLSLYTLSEASRDRFRARTIGYVFQTHYLLNTLTAIENVIMPMAFGKLLPSHKWRNEARTLLETVGLAEFINYYPYQLSTGQRMRVAVARALVNNPQIILADEPTAALDHESAIAVMNLIQAQNAIIIVASHDPTLASRFSTIMNLNEGSIA